MKKRTRIFCAVAAVFLAYQGYYSFYYGHSYQEPVYSPNKAFYYQKYRLFSWSSRCTTPVAMYGCSGPTGRSRGSSITVVWR